MKIEIKNYQGRLYLTVSNRIQQERVAFPEISLLGCNNIASYYFFKLYPFILVIPAGFSVPLFFEVILNVISFPMDAHGNLFGYGLYTVNYKNICNYTMFDLYYSAPVLYAVVMSAYFGIVTAVFSTLPSAVSCLSGEKQDTGKGKALLFL